MDDHALHAYLHETLGIDPSVSAWADAGKLPYFLQDAYEFRTICLRDSQILLAIDKRSAKPGLADVRTQVERLRQLAGTPVIYVTDALASYERKRLIEQKVPFMVPGNQLYLPDLGIDLREYFRQPLVAPRQSLSPATQAMLIAVLLRRPWPEAWQPASLAADLGYTTMTVSRVVKELVAAGVATGYREGRVRCLQMAGTAAQVWERAKPMLRSPVKRRVWVRSSSQCKAPTLRVAGLSALARLSMLSDPPYPTFAVSREQWSATGIEALPRPMSGATECEIWHYTPALVRDSESVDPLSLTLSLQDNGDERVQLALDELRKHFPW